MSWDRAFASRVPRSVLEAFEATGREDSFVGLEDCAHTGETNPTDTTNETVNPHRFRMPAIGWRVCTDGLGSELHEA